MASVKHKVAVIVFPLGKFSTEILAKFLTVLSASSETIHVISGNVPENRLNHQNVRILKLSVSPALYSKSIRKRTAIHILDQLRLVFAYRKIIKQTDMLILPISFNMHMLPLLFGKVMRKKIVVCSTGSSARSTLYLHKKTSLISKLSQVVEKVGYSLADKIMIESPNVIKFNNLYQFKEKIVNGALYVDTQHFSLGKTPSQRTNTVAFVGRLSAEKGIMEFAKAMPLVTAQNPDVSFLIVGVGDLYETASKQLAGYGNVKFAGWVSQQQLPLVLHQAKIVVIPSFTEGLPNLLLEAMSCGAVIVASPVGAIPDLVKTHKTGFLLKDNSPQNIADGVLAALAQDNLDEIAQNASELINREYSISSSINRYKKLVTLTGAV